MDHDKEYINSKIECPVCAIHYAKNYLLVHLNKQHSNIYNTALWENSRYSKRFTEIKEAHRKQWGISNIGDNL